MVRFYVKGITKIINNYVILKAKKISFFIQAYFWDHIWVTASGFDQVPALFTCRGNDKTYTKSLLLY